MYTSLWLGLTTGQNNDEDLPHALQRAREAGTAKAKVTLYRPVESKRRQRSPGPGCSRSPRPRLDEGMVRPAPDIESALKQQHVLFQDAWGAYNHLGSTDFRVA